MLAQLEERDIVETGLEENDANVMLASTEIGVPRAVYQGTSAQAIVHAHPPYAIARSMVCDEIVPMAIAEGMGQEVKEYRQGSDRNETW